MGGGTETESRALKAVLASEDRPREKAKSRGMEALTTAELMAILLGSGSRGESVVELCQRLLNDCDNKLYRLARMSIKDLTRYKGIGEVKAIVLLASLEIARRYQIEKFDAQFQITSSALAYEYLRPLMSHLGHEELWVLVLNRAKRVTDRVRISSGGTSGTVGDVKMILREALARLADGIILSHNHPSDTAHPSPADDSLTRSVKRGCDAVGVALVDHIIVCRGGYYSYCDNGKL